MRPSIFFAGGGGSDARRSGWAAPCLPPASHCSIFLSKCRGGCRSSTKEAQLVTRMFCLCLHARCWVQQKDLMQKGLASREMLRRVPWGSPAQEYVAGLCRAAQSKRLLSLSPLPSSNNSSWARFVLFSYSTSPLLPICCSPRFLSPTVLGLQSEKKAGSSTSLPKVIK